jgi:hypothetical protein
MAKKLGIFGVVDAAEIPGRGMRPAAQSLFFSAKEK